MAKRTITITSQIQVDVEFPYYVSYGYTFCKFISESKNGFYNGIWVSNYTNCNSSINEGVIPSLWITGIAITKEEFEKKFKEVQEKINQLI